MEIPKVNVRGEMNALGLNQSLTLPKGDYKLSVVRTTAHALKSDTGKAFSVAVGNEVITVIRTA
jgi:hypothetical protein